MIFGEEYWRTAGRETMSSLVETYREAMRLMIAKGMTPLEALREFDQDKFNAALREELETCYGCGQDEGSLLVMVGKAGREEMNEKDMEQAIELWLAGWTSELPNKTQTDVMSWYWRRPPRVAGKQGRLFLSTNQAHRAMRKEAGGGPGGV